MNLENLGDLVKFGRIWRNLVKFGKIWKDLGKFGEIWKIKEIWKI